MGLRRPVLYTPKQMGLPVSKLPLQAREYLCSPVPCSLQHAVVRNT